MLGDVGGWVGIWALELDMLAAKKSAARFTSAQLWRAQLHGDWVTRAQFVPDLHAVMSASLDATLCLTDIEQRCGLGSYNELVTVH